MVSRNALKWYISTPPIGSSCASSSQIAFTPEELSDRECCFVQVTVGKVVADDGEPESKAAAAGAAKGKVVSAMMRKHLVEGMVPIMAELKRLLESQRHPLLPALMLTMRTLLKDHKSEASARCLQIPAVTCLPSSSIKQSHPCTIMLQNDNGFYVGVGQQRDMLRLEN